VVLSAKEQNQVYIPKGFAHGYLTLSECVQFLYKCSDFYDSADDRGILWSDPAIGIPWSIKEPLVSEKDARFSTLSRTPVEFLPKYDPK
jgi:dTDP-4-dehydrorhamnose 3,5-epimerase